MWTQKPFHNKSISLGSRLIKVQNYLINIIGAGLAGSEAAYQLAFLAKQYDIDITINLYEMRPQRRSPAHHSDKFAELVCSNSFGSELLTTARGLLIAEMQAMESLIISAAHRAKVPAGQALAVDRELFAQIVTESLEQEPLIHIHREEVKSIPREALTIVATGPLTSEDLSADISSLIADSKFLRFFDAASPIVSADTIDMDIAFKASRYDKSNTNDEGDYINCPFYSQEEFDNFYEELIKAERSPQKAFELESMPKFFESCLPIEVIASRGAKTLCFGPMKPVGLRDPRRPDSKPVAVVQLRQDNAAASLYNIVGFQTNLKWSEQKRIFSLIPGLQAAEFVRYGVMHQNIYLNSPACLSPDLNLKDKEQIYFAGQITGVEGYTESAATGIIVARKIINKLLQREPLIFPRETMLGALNHYISAPEILSSKQDFQPMNANWGLINFGLDPKLSRDKKLRNETLVQRALESLTRLGAKVIIPSHQ